MLPPSVSSSRQPWPARSGTNPKALRRALRQIEELLDEQLE